MAWLPGHTCVGSLVDVTKVHTSPSRFTTAPHIRVPLKSPPTVPPDVWAEMRNALSWFSLGKPWQLLGMSANEERAGENKTITKVNKPSAVRKNHNLFGI